MHGRRVADLRQGALLELDVDEVGDDAQPGEQACDCRLRVRVTVERELGRRDGAGYRRGRDGERGRHGRPRREGREPDVVGEDERQLAEDAVPDDPPRERRVERPHAGLLVRNQGVLGLDL